MPIYKVAIFASLFVDSESIEEAEEIAHDHIIGCLIPAREFCFDTEEWEDDEERSRNYLEIINAKEYLDKEENNGN